MIAYVALCYRRSTWGRRAFFSNQEQKRLSILEIFVGYEILVSKRQENGG
jgi:hypothetical protein